MSFANFHNHVFHHCFPNLEINLTQEIKFEMKRDCCSNHCYIFPSSFTNWKSFFFSQMCGYLRDIMNALWSWDKVLERNSFVLGRSICYPYGDPLLSCTWINFSLDANQLKESAKRLVQMILCFPLLRPLTIKRLLGNVQHHLKSFCNCNQRVHTKRHGLYKSSLCFCFSCVVPLILNFIEAMVIHCPLEPRAMRNYRFYSNALLCRVL